MKWYINNWRCQIDEKIWQCRGYPQKKHVIQQLIPTLCYLNQPKKKKKKKMSAFKRVNAIISRKASKSGETLPHTQTADTKLTPRCD